MTVTDGLDAEDVAVLCLLETDGDLRVSVTDLADLLDATERRAHANFGPVPGILRQAFAGLVLEAGLASRGELHEGGIEAALDRVTLRELLPPMLTRDRVWFTPGGVYWTWASPAALAGPGTRRRAEILLELAAAGAAPSRVVATLERLGLDRSFIVSLLERERNDEDEDVRRQVAYEDWYE